MVAAGSRPAHIAVLLVAILCACRGGAKPGDGPYADKVATAIPLIEKSVGVKFKTPPKLEIRSRQQVRDYLVRKFNETAPQQEIAGEEATYKLLGLIPDTLDLRKLLVNLLTQQIVGYYDPATKVLYVVAEAPQDLVGTTITHELVHALQDQYVNLDSLQHITGDEDKQTAVQAVIEGQATAEQMAILVGGDGNIAARLPGGWDRVRDMIRDNMSADPLFTSVPVVIQESLLFPYINGADFIRRFKELRPGTLPYGSMPQSTKQVMHERAYFATPRDDPIPVTLPTIPGSIDQNDLGEFGTRLLLFQHLHDQNTASRAAAGWTGDRYVLTRTPSGKAIAWVTVWDTPLDAAEFVTAIGDAMAKRYNTAAPATTAGGVRQLAGHGRTVRIRQQEISGRNVVLFEDVPQGQGSMLDLRKVKLGRT
jgi:hypothetical protein